MAIDLYERITTNLLANPRTAERLRTLSPAVIEDVLRLGIRWLSDHVPAETDACDLATIDFEACEGCGHLIDFENPEGAIHDAEGIPLCNACAVEATPEPPDRALSPGEEER